MVSRLFSDAYHRARSFLVGRAGAYQRVFKTPNQDVEVVLADLARFCRAHTSTAAPDPYVAARLDGRREVWLRLQAHLKLSNDTLWLLFDGSPPPQNQPRGNDQ